MRRTQIYLDEEQDRRLGERARSLRTTKSDLIRSAIEDYLSRPTSADQRLAEFRGGGRGCIRLRRHLPAGREHRASHRRLGAADLSIAATALLRGVPLATSNVKDFPMFPCLAPAY